MQHSSLFPGQHTSLSAGFKPGGRNTASSWDAADALSGVQNKAFLRWFLPPLQGWVSPGRQQWKQMPAAVTFHRAMVSFGEDSSTKNQFSIPLKL